MLIGLHGCIVGILVTELEVLVVVTFQVYGDFHVKYLLKLKKRVTWPDRFFFKTVQCHFHKNSVNIS